MSNSKESTLKTQFSLSIDSNIFEDSGILSGYEFEDSILNNPQASKTLQDMLCEIELINEDRSRLRLENERFKILEKELIKKNIQIELLQKIATKALSENYVYKQNFTPFKNNTKIQAKPSNKATLKVLSENNHLDSSNQRSDIASTNSSPLKSQRNLSSRIRVTRNYLKYPRNNSMFKP